MTRANGPAGVALEVFVIPTEYVISVVPEVFPEWATWSVKVARRNSGRWAVCHFSQVYSRSQAKAKHPVPVYERLPSGRSDHFKDVYRFPLDEALDLAKLIAPKLVINGLTGAGYMAWFREKHGEPK